MFFVFVLSVVVLFGFDTWIASEGSTTFPPGAPTHAADELPPHGVDKASGRFSSIRSLLAHCSRFDRTIVAPMLAAVDHSAFIISPVLIRAAINAQPTPLCDASVARVNCSSVGSGRRPAGQKSRSTRPARDPNELDTSSTACFFWVACRGPCEIGRAS